MGCRLGDEILVIFMIMWLWILVDILIYVFLKTIKNIWINFKNRGEKKI